MPVFPMERTCGAHEARWSVLERTGAYFSSSRDFHHRQITEAVLLTFEALLSYSSHEAMLYSFQNKVKLKLVKKKSQVPEIDRQLHQLTDTSTCIKEHKRTGN